MLPVPLADPKSASLSGEHSEAANANLLAMSLAPGVVAQAHAHTFFAVENAKSARAALKAMGHPKPIRELEIIEIGHAPDAAVVKQLISRVRAGEHLAVLSEAGCPGVADPGAQLAEEAHAVGISVVPLSGPSAILLGLMASGLNGQRFAFVGYVPDKSPAREEALRALEARSRRDHETQILIETPYRNMALLKALIATLSGNTRLCVAVDLTLPREEIKTRSVAQWRSDTALNRVEKRQAVFLFLA
jgi:16S rRNA (cytidine1402-2'-O)-methyltransferase